LVWHHRMACHPMVHCNSSTHILSLCVVCCVLVLAADCACEPDTGDCQVSLYVDR
jgi:hypothetical protein